MYLHMLFVIIWFEDVLNVYFLVKEQQQEFYNIS